jgi:hypothetical protein
MDNTLSMGAPHMSAAETELFSAVLDQSHRYLEFGMGGSSLLAVRAKLDTLVSVDSGECIRAGDETTINSRLSAPGSRALLCPGAVIEITHPIILGFDDQELATVGSPRGGSRHHGPLPAELHRGEGPVVHLCWATRLITHRWTDRSGLAIS